MYVHLVVWRYSESVFCVMLKQILYIFKRCVCVCVCVCVEHSSETGSECQCNWEEIQPVDWRLHLGFFGKSASKFILSAVIFMLHVMWLSALSHSCHVTLSHSCHVTWLYKPFYYVTHFITLTSHDCHPHITWLSAHVMWLCHDHCAGHVPADVDLQTGVWREWEETSRQKVSLEIFCIVVITALIIT